jgi:hypothetical protein
MSFDLMGMIHNAMSWFGGGGTDVGKNGGHAEGNAGVGAGMFDQKSSGRDPLATLAGNAGPMDWSGAGIGGAAGGTLSNKKSGDFLGGNLGLGLGAGYSKWEEDEKHGLSGAAGGVAPVGLNMGGKNTQLSASTNVYSGVGGSVFSEGDTAGFKANAVPLGLGNTNVGLNTKYGSVNASAGNAYLNKYGAEGEAGRDKDGTYFAKGSVSQKMGASDVNVGVNTKYGNASAGVGEISKGPEISGGVFYDPKNQKGGVNNVGFDAALEAKDIHSSYNIGNGAVSNQTSIGGLKYDEEYGFKGGTAGWDNKNKQVFAGVDEVRGGGFDVTNVKTQGNVGGLKYGASLGEFSNDNRIEGANFTAGKDSAQLGVKHAEGMGMSFNNFDANASVGSGNWKTSANAGFKSLGNTNSIDGAQVGVDYKNWKDPSLNAKFDKLSYGGWGGEDLHASVNGPFGAKASAGVDGFTTTNFAAEDFNAKLSKDGLNASLGHGSYSDFDIKGAHYDASLGKYANVSAKADEIASDKFDVTGAKVSSSFNPFKGTSISADKASYDEVYLKGLAADQNLGNGAVTTHLGLGEGSMNHASATDIHASANLTNGVSAGLKNGQYSFLQGKDIDAKVGLGNGAVGVGVGAKDATVGSVGAKSLQFDTNLKSTNLDVQGLDATGFKAHDIHADANVGKLGLGVGAQTLATNDLHVDNASLHTDNFGTKGNAGVSGVNFDALNVKGGNVGLGWGGKEFLGAGGDVRTGAGVDKASAGWDLSKGTAGASFQNANVGGQLSNAHLNLFGNNIAIPDMGAKLNASGGANLDLAHGAANANLSLGGSSVNFAGHSLTVPDWVQAGAGVNLSQGAANVNLGGKNGVGADINLSKGEFGLDAFGYHADVAGGIRSAGSAIKSGAQAVGGAIADGASAVGHGIANGASAVGGAISDGWHAVTSW